MAQKKNKNVQVAKIVKFIKTCDQYPLRFHFVNFFICKFSNFFNCWGKNRSSENAAWEEWVISFCLGDNDKNLGGEFCLGVWVKTNRFNFLNHNVFASNLNTINLKLFCNHGGIYRWPASLLKMSLFHRCFSNILLVKTNYLVST